MGLSGLEKENNEEICYRFRCYLIAFVAFELVQAMVC